MDYRRYLAGAVVLTGCTHAFATATETRTSSAPQTVFECVKQQLGALEYKQSSIDANELRINATKIDLTTRRADTQFHRMLDKLQVEVAPAADGQTSIKVLPQTFAEYTTQRGPTEVEEKPSERVTEDGQRLLERCKS